MRTDPLFDPLFLESWRWLGPVTPLGGLSFIAGWVVLLVAVARKA